MESGRPSATARSTALSRAAHQLLDHPRVLEDPIALRIIGPDAAASIQAASERFTQGIARYLRAFLVARSRYAEDELRKAVDSGATQYVVLGAGLDTSAYRNRLPGLRMFEVDHPSTQDWKRKLLADADIPVPASLAFVPSDFESGSLLGELRKGGFQPAQPTFFSWLGVTMYLEREWVMTMLQDIASSVFRPTVVFDYAVRAADLGAASQVAMQEMASRVARAGEPWKAWFDPQELMAELAGIGFDTVEDIGPEQINARYFGNRNDGLRVGSLARLMKASAGRASPGVA